MHKQPIRHQMMRALKAAAVCSVAPLLANFAQGANLTWDPAHTPATPSGGSGTWDNSANWSNLTADSAWNGATETDVAIFNGTAGTVTLSAGGATTKVDGLNFNSVSGYDLIASTANDTITMSGTNAILFNGTTGAVTIDANLVTSGTATFAGNGAMGLRINGNIALGGTLTLDSGPSGTITSTGIISGNFGLIRPTTNQGVVVLAGANTFDGGVTIARSTMFVSSIGNWRVGNTTASNLGSPTSALNGTIGIGGTGTPVLAYTGTGEMTNRTISILGTAGQVNNNGTGALIFTADMTTGGASAKTFALGGTATVASVFEGKVVDTSAAAPTGFSEGGVWVLRGANTFTGKTNIGGTLVVGSLNSVSGGSASSALGAPTTAANGLIGIGSGNGSGQLVYIGTGETTDRGIDLGQNTTGSGVITLQNEGTGDVNFTSNFTVSTIANTHTLTLAGSAGGSLTGNINPTTGTIGPTGLVKNGAGTWALKGSAYNINTLTDNGGMLTLDLSANSTGILSSTNASTVTTNTGLVLSGGTLKIVGKGSGASSQTFGALAVGNSTVGTASSIVIDPSTGTGTTMSYTAALTRNTRSTLNIDLSAAGASMTATTVALNDSIMSSGTTTPGFITVKDSTGVGFATASGGVISRYTAGTLLTTTTTTATTNYTLGSGNFRFTADANQTVNSLSIDTTGGGKLDISAAATLRTLSIDTGAVVVAGSGDYDITDGQFGANASEVFVHQYSTGRLTISASVGGTTATLTKAGPGTLVLTGSNTYTSPTAILGGVVEVSNAANLGSNAANSGAGTILMINGGTLKFGTASFDFSSGSTLARTVDIGDNGATIDTNGFDQVLANPIGGVVNANRGGLTKAGDGILTLSGVNTFQGPTVITGGTLKLASGASIASSYSIKLAGGALDVSPQSTFTLLAHQTLRGSGTVTGATTSNVINGVIQVGPDHGKAGTASTITVTGGAVQLVGSDVQLDLFSLGGSADKLSAGSIDYGGVLTVSNQTGSSISSGSWDLFDGTQVGTDTFDRMVLPTLAAGTWSFDYSTGVLSVTGVPEPSTLGLLAVGGLGLLKRRRRSK